MLKDQSPEVRGLSGLWRVHNDGRVEAITFKQNQIQYAWGFAAVMAMCKRQPLYGISSMYIEYENVADPTDPVTIPTFGREEGREYYQDLESSGTRDYLRVPLLQDPMLGIQAGFENFFTAGVNGNKATFFAQTAGIVGVNGKTFSTAANSKICGAALIATPVIADITQDIIVARAYYSVDEQEVKGLSSQLGVSWELYFG